LNFDDTIAAISTPPGSGAIAIVRLAGRDSWAIVARIFSAGKNFKAGSGNLLKTHAATHGFIANPSSQEPIDEVVVIAYKSPNSYTGEDLVEINCHGSAYVAAEVLSLCVAQGARLARPGEFTQRAFLNGRMDLTQAEAVLDLINSQTGRQSRQALSALSGDVGGEIKAVRNNLIELLSRVVAGIDFPEEVGDISLDDLTDVVCASLARLNELARTVRSGRFLREGLHLAIVGRPNVGKSSLLNQLLKFERAIVTDVPGTTRDSLEELLDMNGIPVVLVDTAGIRDTADQVERIGIERTYKAIAAADVVLMLVDATADWSSDDSLIAKMLLAKPYFVLANKIDAVPDFDLDKFSASLNETAMTAVSAKDQASAPQPAVGIPCTSGENASGTDQSCGNSAALGLIAISALTGQGMSQLTDALEAWVLGDTRGKDRGASLNHRQGELCLRAVEALELVRQTALSGMPQDCLATDLKTAVDCLSEICGEAVSEEIIANVFATFCIGK
jgi:tRNA modification GTPase